MDAVVGFPTRDEASTIGHVVAAVEAGLRSIGAIGRVVLVNADNGSVDGTPEAFRAAPGDTRRVTIATGAEGTGKGTNVLAILDAALDLGAERVAIFDGDLRSIGPEWVVRMLRATDGPAPTMATPVYRRNRYGGNITKHLAGPLVAATLGARIRQPIAGDFAFNRAFVERAVTWPLPESARGYGIDVHLTGNAAREGARIIQVPLGRKVHNPGFQKVVPMGRQVVDSAFHVIARAGRCLPAPRARAPRAPVDDVAVRPNAALVEGVMRRVRGYLADHRDDVLALFPSAKEAAPAPNGLLTVDAGLWGDVLADALAAVADGHAARARDHLVALYLCRAMTHWAEIERTVDPVAVAAALDAQTDAVIAAVTRRRLRFTIVPPPAFAPGAWSGREALAGRAGVSTP